MLDIFETEIESLTKEEKRKVYVYVPDTDGPFPVLYMFDGHNVFFDEDASYGKSWGMYDYLVNNKIPLMVVGVECNHHHEQHPYGGRLSEYSPFDFSDPDWGNIKGRGKKTMDFYTKELKPYIDDNYPTLRQREYTFIAGSSMGGLMSVYALLKYNKIYSRAAALSPSFIFAPDKVEELINNSRIKKNTILYMDYGENEFKYRNSRQVFAHMCDVLINKKVLLETRVVPGGNHNEASWEKQIPFFMNTLFYDL